MTELVFVFGTLKAGFPNFRVNKGVRVPGEFATAERFPLYIVGERHVPWLIDAPGHGAQVVGEVYAADRDTLADMDALERVTEPDGYRRMPIEVVPRARPNAARLTVFAYLKSPAQLAGESVHGGPLTEYSPAHAATYQRRP